MQTNEQGLTELQGALSKLEVMREGLNKQLLGVIESDSPDDDGDFLKHFQLLNAIKHVQDAARSIGKGIEQTARITYVMSSVFLQDCVDQLTQNTRAESMVYVTGVRVGPYAMVSRMLPVKLDERTPVFASADPAASHQLLVALQERDHKLLAVFHSHIGNGPGAICPSPTDIRNQCEYEAGGYICLGGIFSLDGYVRFFGQEDSPVVVYGKGVTQYGERLYRVERNPLPCGGNV